jgi:LemA protein
MNIVFFAAAAVVILILVIPILIYNAFIRRKNRIEEAWSDIEVQLKRRYDLIPNLLETVKGYAAHERGVFENVTRARSAALGAKTAKEHAEAENALASTLKTLFAVAENYPDLKANANFLDLQRELADTENKIQSARRFYNSTVLDYNTMVESFPSNLIARSFGFSAREFFDLESEGEAKPVKVAF